MIPIKSSVSDYYLPEESGLTPNIIIKPVYDKRKTIRQEKVKRCFITFHNFEGS